MRRLLPRAAIALVAALLVAWSVVLWRDEQIGAAASGRIIHDPDMSDVDFARQLDRLHRAELLDPSTKWPLARAGGLLLRGRERAAARVAESVLEREPDNLEAWLLLGRATRGRDPRRAAEAAAEIRRLNPRQGARRRPGAAATRRRSPPAARAARPG